MNFNNVPSKPQGTSKHELIEGSIKLVAKIASKYHGDKEELMSEGLIGLCEAAESFDPARDVAFSTHASWSIKAHIMRYIVDNHSQVKVGTTLPERILFFRLPREESKLINQGLPATSDAVAVAVGQGITSQDVDAMRARMATASCASLDAGNVSEDGLGLTLMEKLNNGDGTPESIVAEKEADTMILNLMIQFEQTLSQVENTVWQSCIASENDRQGSVVAESTGLCRQRISQIKNDLVNRFVKYAKRNGLGK